jgi:coatomer subunit gamma
MYPQYPELAGLRLPKMLLVCSSSYANIFMADPYESLGPTTLDTIGVPASKKISDAPPPPSAAEKQSAYAQQLAEVPEFASYGPILNSSANPVQLTESETEYQVTCVKHLFAEHVVFQVSID